MDGSMYSIGVVPKMCCSTYTSSKAACFARYLQHHRHSLQKAWNGPDCSLLLPSAHVQIFRFFVPVLWCSLRRNIFFILPRGAFKIFIYLFWLMITWNRVEIVLFRESEWNSENLTLCYKVCWQYQFSRPRLRLSLVARPNHHSAQRCILQVSFPVDLLLP